MYSHGLPYIFNGKHSDEAIGRFARETLLKCAPGISPAEIDRLYELNFKPMLKSLGLRNKTELFKRFKHCALYLDKEYFELETQKREGRFAYFTFGEERKLSITASDTELGRAIRETLAASS